MLNEVSHLVAAFTYSRIYQSLCEFCSGSEFDDQVRKILSNLLKLFKKAALQFNRPNFDLSESLNNLANDLSLSENVGFLNFQPIITFGNESLSYIVSLLGD